MAQFGRALRSGRRGRRFESCRLDQKQKGGNSVLLFFDWVIRFKFVQSVPNAVRDAGLKNRPRPVDDEGRFFGVAVKVYRRYKPL